MKPNEHTSVGMLDLMDSMVSTPDVRVLSACQRRKCGFKRSYKQHLANTPRSRTPFTQHPYDDDFDIIDKMGEET